MPIDKTNGPIELDENTRLRTVHTIQETRGQLDFLSMLVSRGECTPTAVNTHLAMLRNQFSELSRLLDAGETISRALDEARASNREAHQRIRDLEAQIRTGTTAAAATSRIRHLITAFNVWRCLHGFHHADISPTDFGIRVNLSSTVLTGPDDADERFVESGDAGLAMELSCVIPHLFGENSEWDMFTDRRSRAYLENTDANRARFDKLLREFPTVTRPTLLRTREPWTANPAISGFTSDREQDRFDLGVKFFLSYEQIERWLDEIQQKAAREKAMTVKNGKNGKEEGPDA